MSRINVGGRSANEDLSSDRSDGTTNRTNCFAQKFLQNEDSKKTKKTLAGIHLKIADRLLMKIFLGRLL